MNRSQVLISAYIKLSRGVVVCHGLLPKSSPSLTADLCGVGWQCLRQTRIVSLDPADDIGLTVVARNARELLEEGEHISAHFWHEAVVRVRDLGVVGGEAARSLHIVAEAEGKGWGRLRWRQLFGQHALQLWFFFRCGVLAERQLVQSKTTGDQE